LDVGTEREPPRPPYERCDSVPSADALPLPEVRVPAEPPLGPPFELPPLPAGGGAQAFE